ncbi:MAG: restriction endonuclease [Pyrodictiaceae archaeon]
MQRIGYEPLIAHALLELLARRGEADIQGVAEKAGVSETIACSVIEEMAREASGLLSLEGCASVTTQSVLELALYMISKGFLAPEKAARLLDWRLFEEFASRVLASYGYKVYRHVYKPPPRGFEVDVVAIEPVTRLAIAVDCKHWSPRHTSPSRLREAARRHSERVRLLAVYWGLARNMNPRPAKPSRLLPVLLVLRENLPRIVDGVAIVPASRLRGFMEQLDYVLEDPAIRLIEPP